jgi:hypothetical protein
MADFDSFKTCMRIQENLDMEAWDVILFQPLQDLHAWWTRQSDATKAYMNFLAGAEVAALTLWISKVAGIAGAEIAGLFATLLIVVLGSAALAVFMASVGRCLLQQV